MATVDKFWLNFVGALRKYLKYINGKIIMVGSRMISKFL